MIGKLLQAVGLMASDPGAMGRKRSPQWKKVRAAWLKDHPTCAACGTNKNLAVHHIAVFHLHPERELDPTNLVALCESPGQNHHLLVGHWLSWQSYNENVREDAAHLLAGIRNRP